MIDRKKLRGFLEAVAGNGALDASATSPATVLALLKELDAKDARIDEERAIVNRVWEALGISTYAEANGLAIDEHVKRLKTRIERLRDVIRRVLDEDASDDPEMDLEEVLAADDEAAKS